MIYRFVDDYKEVPFIEFRKMAWDGSHVDLSFDLVSPPLWRKQCLWMELFVDEESIRIGSAHPNIESVMNSEMESIELVSYKTDTTRYKLKRALDKKDQIEEKAILVFDEVNKLVENFRNLVENPLSEVMEDPVGLMNSHFRNPTEWTEEMLAFLRKASGVVIVEKSEKYPNQIHIKSIEKGSSIFRSLLKESENIYWLRTYTSGENDEQYYLDRSGYDIFNMFNDSPDLYPMDFDLWYSIQLESLLVAWKNSSGLE